MGLTSAIGTAPQMPDSRYLNAMVVLTLVAFGTLTCTFLNHGPGLEPVETDAFGGTLSQRWQVLAGQPPASPPR
jgi:hypothetical protein